jgi:hypothetical protein
MKRLNPETNLPFKRGNLRYDGYIFWGYKNTIKTSNGFFKEEWCSPATYKYAVLVKQNSDRRYSKNNRAVRNANEAARQARKLQASPPWLTAEHKAQIAEFYEMAKELEKVFPWPQHVDHIEPLQGKDVCGLHVPWNLQILSVKANLEKGNR